MPFQTLSQLESCDGRKLLHWVTHTYSATVKVFINRIGHKQRPPFAKHVKDRTLLRFNPSLDYDKACRNDYNEFGINSFNHQ